MARRMFKVPITTTGVAGSAVGSARILIPGGWGTILGVGVDYNAAAPATTDLTLKSSVDGYETTHLTLTDRSADLPFSPLLAPAIDSTGATVANTENPNLVVPRCFGELLIDIAECDAFAEAAVVRVLIDVGA